MTIEIYYDDLKDEKKAELNLIYGIENASDMNWDIVPLAVIELDDKEIKWKKMKPLLTKF